MYDKGNGVRRDTATARDWFRRACENGHQPSCEALAKLDAQE